MAYIFQRHADGGSSSTSISIEIQTLIAELQKYGSIKSTIEQLGQEADKLRNEIASLKAHKQDILARSIYSRQDLSGLLWTTDLLRNQIKSLRLLCITY